MTTAATGPTTRHAEARERLLAQYAAIPAGEPVRLAKHTSNLFRPRTTVSRPGLDVSDLDRVLWVDPDARTADVQGMTTYEHLVDATLPHGLMPTVVPQLKTITLGGAVTGLGIESSSFRDGLPHEAVREIEVLTGAGEIVTATPTEHADLYRAFPNSYGTLGYALRLVVDLLPVRPYVHLRHVRFDRPAELAAAHRRDRREWTVGRRVGRLPRRHRVLRHRELPDARVLGGQCTVHIGLHRAADLLPVGAEPPGGLPDRPGLPVAVGHRLVLVLARVRRAEPAHPPVLAEALAAQRRLLEDDRAGEPLPRGRAGGPGPRPAAAGAADPGRGDPARPHRRLPGLVPARGAGAAGLGLPAEAAPDRAGRHPRRR